MRFVETQKGIWIPKGTTLEEHAPKTRNYALLHDLAVEGVITLDTLVSVPPTDPKLSRDYPLLYRVDYVEEILAALFSDSRIRFQPEDYLVRSALTFEDTVATRAAGIGDSRRFEKYMSPEKKRGMLISVLGHEINPDIRAYTEKHGISSFALGIQICPTVGYYGRAAYSGSAKLLADDFVEIAVNEGHSFVGGRNKVPAFRYYFQKEEGKWTLQFERKDNEFSALDEKIRLEIAFPLLKTLDTLKERRDFPNGIEVEYVKQTEDSPITLVQYAPIPSLVNRTFCDAPFQFKDYPYAVKQIIIGVGERYFSPEEVFVIGYNDEKGDRCREKIEQLMKMNSTHPEGYVFVDGRNANDGPVSEIPYPWICNATALIHPHAHVGLLSDHMCLLAREHATMIAIPNCWMRTEHQIGKRAIDSAFMIAYAEHEGLSLRVNERTQECFVAYGNVWKK